MGIKLSVNGLCVTHLDSRMMLEVSINGEVNRDIKEEMSEMGRCLRWAVNIRLFFFFFFSKLLYQLPDYFIMC